MGSKVAPAYMVPMFECPYCGETNQTCESDFDMSTKCAYILCEYCDGEVIVYLTD